MNTTAIRVVLLATLLFGLNAWTIRHLGSGLQEFAIVNTFLGFLAIAMSWIESDKANGIRETISNLLRRVSQFQVLLPLYLIAIVGTSLFSSITVLSDGVNVSAAVYITPEGSTKASSSDGKRLQGPNASVRFARMTSIFGRAFYIEADGYQRKSFMLYPWTGKNISIASDLTRQPALYIRIPGTRQSQLANGRIVITIDGLKEQYEVATEEDHATIQVGPAAAIPEAWRSEWQSELLAEGLPESLREQLLRNWLNTTRNDSLPIVLPGQVLTIRFFAAADATDPALQRTYIVGREPLQDVPLSTRSQP